MENNVHEYEEISIQEIIGMLWKNKYFILTCLVAGLFVGLFFSGIKMIQNPVEYRYQAKVTLELVDGAEMKNQPRTMLYVMESRSILDASLSKVKITSGDYQVTTDASSKPNQYDVIVEGPDKKQVVNLVNEVVEQGRTVASSSMTMSKNTIVENGHLYGSPIKISKGVNFTLNSIISFVLAGILSVFLIAVIRYMSGKVYTRNEVEKILGTRVIVNIPFEEKKNNFERFFKVR